jgi:hypothetical protein
LYAYKYVPKDGRELNQSQATSEFLIAGKPERATACRPTHVASVVRTWLDDDDPGLARTMAALDRGLARGSWWSGLLDDLCRFVPMRFCPPGRWSRRRRDAAGDEEVAAA